MRACPRVPNGCCTGTYVSLGILSDGLAILGAVMAVVPVSGDGAEVSKEGDAREEMHVGNG